MIIREGTEFVCEIPKEYEPFEITLYCGKLLVTSPNMLAAWIDRDAHKLIPLTWDPELANHPSMITRNVDGCDPILTGILNPGPKGK